MKERINDASTVKVANGKARGHADTQIVIRHGTPARAAGCAAGRAASERNQAHKQAGAAGRQLACRRSRLRSMRTSQGASPGPSPPVSACTII